MAWIETESLAGGVRSIALAHGKVNTLHRELMEEFRARLREAVADPEVRAILVSGRNGNFSAGLDFKRLMAARMAGPEEGAAFGEAVRGGVLDLWTCPKPTVAAVTGHSIAAGFMVALACDFRYVTKGPGEYGFNELAFGAGFPALTMAQVHFVLGWHGRKVMYGSRLYDWEEGMRNGSFDEAFESPEATRDAAQKHAAYLGSMPKEAYANVKEQLQAPFLKIVAEETAEDRARREEIYSSEESMAAMMRHVQRFMGGGS